MALLRGRVLTVSAAITLVSLQQILVLVEASPHPHRRQSASPFCLQSLWQLRRLQVLCSQAGVGRVGVVEKAPHLSKFDLSLALLCSGITQKEFFQLLPVPVFELTQN